MSTDINIKQYTDAQLISRYRESDNNVFVGELFQRYSHLVYGVCYKYLENYEDSRDASVEIFEQLLVKLKNHEVTYFKSWLYSVAKNHCLMKLRKKKNHVELNEGVADIVENRQETHLSSVHDKEEQLKQLEEAIPQLNHEQRLCVDLFYLKQKSYQEIVEETGFNFKQVKSYIQNGKRNLKIVLMKGYERKTS